MNAGTDTVEVIRCAIDDADHHCRMFGFCTGPCAILAVTGDIEHRAQLLLQLQRLQHQLFGTGVVIDGRQGWKGLFAGEQDIGRVKMHGVLPGGGANEKGHGF